MWRGTLTEIQNSHDFQTKNIELNIFVGYECWDHVSVWSCWGRCDSREISDWKFPYKKSYHPVCVHASRSKSIAHLRFCHPLADPSTRRYEYMEADSCHCQVRYLTSPHFLLTYDMSREVFDSQFDFFPIERLKTGWINIYFFQFF